MTLFLFLCSLFTIIVSQAKAGDPVSCDNSRGNYTANSTYDNNLKTLLSNFSSHTEINYGFYNLSYGQHPDKIKAIGLCRGDIEPDQCRTKLNNSIGYLREQCPNQKEAILWGADFTLWYSYRLIFGILETNPSTYSNYHINDQDSTQYNEALSLVMVLMINLTAKAASGDSRRKYAAGSVNTQLYGLVQCMPDLSSQDCSNCLYTATSEIQKNDFFSDVFKPSCRIQYDTYRFYNSTIELDSLSLPPSPLPTSAFSNNTLGKLLTAPYLKLKQIYLN